MAKHRIRRWFQFGVLDLLILTTIVAVVGVLWRPPRIETYYEPLADGTTPGQHWAGNGLRMKFRWCPAGEFKMGEPPDQVDVTLTRGFWLGKCEVTQGEYHQVMNDNPSFFSPAAKGGPLVIGVDVEKLPVENVSWEAAVEFCRLLTEQEQKAGRLPAAWEYRLPSEAQWEHGCRAGTQTRYSFGDHESRSADFVWHAENSGDRTHEVGQKLPNAWGLHDMHGNVWEWSGDTYQDALAGGTDPQVMEPLASRWTVRGGSCACVGSCPSAIRDWHARSSGNYFTGFRVALIRSREGIALGKPP